MKNSTLQHKENKHPRDPAASGFSQYCTIESDPISPDQLSKSYALPRLNRHSQQSPSEFDSLERYHNQLLKKQH
jgi:hypothetical protein